MRMKCNKVLSALLAILMVLGSFASLAYAVFADEADASTDTVQGSETTGDPDNSDTDTGDGTDDDNSGDTTKIDYLNRKFASAEEKIASMELKLERYGYQLYYDSYTGEVAYVNTVTGQSMFTNPIDIPSSTSAKKTKQHLLSQLVVNYTEGSDTQTFYSFVEAAERGQIKMKYIKNGIRVEYTIGQEETRSLVPRLINADHFEEQILNLITDASQKKKLMNFFMKKDAYAADMTERMRQEMILQYPITEQMAVYIIGPDTTDREFDELEQIIKTYCPLFTYEVLEQEHELVNYQGNEDDPPVFKMSLEYYLDENGLTVRLPANGIRFNESTYTLNYIDVLPWFGCASEEYEGYTFYPDGSGTVTRFENLTNLRTLSGQLYGRDYAYHTLTGSNNAQTVRMPVFGVVENTTYTEKIKVGEEEKPGYWDAFGDYHEPEIVDIFEDKVTQIDRGYVAIIEEGDSLANITSTHGGKVTHKYSTVYTTFYPRPTDAYNLSDAISVGDNTTVSVSSKRKYTGSYKIRYILLTDSGIAEEKNLPSYYECSYVGMAKAYREYLESTGVLTRLTEQDVKNDIPLYVESFGSIETSDTFLTFPITAQKPLTTFENLKTMYDKMAEGGISNVKFRLNGFANGGLNCTVPNGIKFDKAVGGNDGYSDFLAYANEKRIEVYPEFDLSYMHATANFDGFSFKRDAAKAIDGRYVSKRIYDPSYQDIVYTGLSLISNTVFADYYKNLSADLSSLGVSGISLGTLGSDLNSDFNDDDPSNREDSKSNVNAVLEKADQLTGGKVMVDGGNAYVLKYVSHILNTNLDSSHFTYADEAVPFLGMVLHGYISFAGTPTNMAGNIQYEILKIIENGAAPYFTLSYQNTSLLKDSLDFSKYYSIDFDIWYDDLVKYYNELNDALSDVQTSTIDGHGFLIGLRTPTDLEKKYDEEQAQKDAEARAEEERQKQEEAARKEEHDRLMAELNGMTYVPPTPETPDTDDGDTDSAEETVNKYTVDNGMIVYVEYGNGVFFILNYNFYEVTVEFNGSTYVLAPVGFVKGNL